MTKGKQSAKWLIFKIDEGKRHTTRTLPRQEGIDVQANDAI